MPPFYSDIRNIISQLFNIVLLHRKTAIKKKKSREMIEQGQKQWDGVKKIQWNELMTENVQIKFCTILGVGCAKV